MPSLSVVALDGPSEVSLEPEIYLTATFRLDDYEFLVGVHGVAFSTRGKLVGTVREAPEKRQGQNEKNLSAIMRWDGNQGRNHVDWNIPLPLTLSPNSLEHIELIRDQDRRHEVHITIKFTVRAIRSRLLLSPTQEESVSGTRGLLAVPPDVTRWTPENDWRWMVSGNGSADVLQAVDQPFEYTATINHGRWIQDYAPRLGLGRHLVAEIPMPEFHSGIHGLPERLVRAIELVPELEALYRDGDWDQVVRRARGIGELLKGDDFRQFLAQELGYDDAAVKAFDAIVSGTFDFPSRVIHQTTKKGTLQPPISPGKEAAQFVYAAAIGLTNLLARKWQRLQA